MSKQSARWPPPSGSPSWSRLSQRWFWGLLWVSGCLSGTGDEALAPCGGAQRNLLGIGSPLILLLGGLGAFVRAYQVWRARGRWWIWQGAGWFLMVLMLFVLTMTSPVALL